MQWWPLLALAGCFQPAAAPDGALCGSPDLAQRCPAGQACVTRDGRDVCLSSIGGDPDTAPPADACAACTPDDSDGDGVPNLADNCPDVANLDQDDEDGVEGGDACDPCPPFVGNDDGDGDGLPDACDPDPTESGDVLREFAGFGSHLPAGWAAVSMQVDVGDALAIASANQGATLTTGKPNTGDTVHIWADGTLVSIAGTALGAMGLVTEIDVPTDDNVVCQLVGNASGATQKLRLFDNANGVLLDEADHAVTAGTRSQLRMAQSGGRFSCTATEPAIETAGASMYKAPTPTIGLRVRSATVRYHWLMVITSP